MTLEITTAHLTLTVHGGDSLRGSALADRMEEEETLGNNSGGRRTHSTQICSYSSSGEVLFLFRGPQHPAVAAPGDI